MLLGVEFQLVILFHEVPTRRCTGIEGKGVFGTGGQEGSGVVR
jgi:hypothetical protein